MNYPYEIHCLHGFLGLPQDWQKVIPNGVVSHAHSIYTSTSLSFDAFAKEKNDTVSETSFKKKRLLLGYSLGGRLALHMLLDRPDLWDHAVIVSAHPGLPNLTDGQDRETRFQADLRWAKRFETESWSGLMKDWEAQAVFSGSKSLNLPEAPNMHGVSREREFNRSILAQALTQWSLGKQANLLPRLTQLGKRIRWVAGEKDSKFDAVARLAASSHPAFRYSCIEKAGHRVPWDQPEIFKNLLLREMDERT